MSKEIQDDLFDPALFMDNTETPALRGSACSNCEKTFFPPRSRCPDCLATDLTAVPLGEKGSLYSFTTVHIPTKNFKPPFTVGYVDMDEGVRIFGQIRLKEGQSLKLGLPMKMSIDYLWPDADGKEVAGYLFELDEE